MMLSYAPTCANSPLLRRAKIRPNASMAGAVRKARLTNSRRRRAAAPPAEASAISSTYMYHAIELPVVASATPSPTALPAAASLVIFGLVLMSVGPLTVKSVPTVSTPPPPAPTAAAYHPMTPLFVAGAEPKVALGVVLVPVFRTTACARASAPLVPLVFTFAHSTVWARTLFCVLAYVSTRLVPLAAASKQR